MIVVADTSPLNYLVTIGHDDLLPKLFGAIVIPPAVLEELSDPDAPEAVRRWAAVRPDWLHIQAAAGDILPIRNLGQGESEGIALALQLNADLILIDDAEAREEAEKRKLTVTGTLGVLRLAGIQNLVDLQEIIEKLLSTKFLCPLVCWPIFSPKWHSEQETMIDK